MRRVSSSTSIKAKRIHSSFVERNRIVIDRASGVDSVKPVPPVRNETSYSSANHLMASDQFYEKLEKLKKEYLKFYHSERNLKEAIEEIDDDKIIDFEHITNLIDKYNKTILALENLDKRVGGRNIANIKEMLNEYSVPLNNIGIYTVRDKELEINEIRFKNSLIKSKDDLNKLLDPIREFIVKLYRVFINIKKENTRDWEYGYEDEYMDKSGLILDSKT